MAPVVEPQLSPAQAARQGGSCGPHIAATFAHLAGGVEHPTTLDVLWRRRTLGPMHAAYEHH
eukprot:6581205-Prorocentrum_lima.AAC.1